MTHLKKKTGTLYTTSSSFLDYFWLCSSIHPWPAVNLSVHVYACLPVHVPHFPFIICLFLCASHLMRIKWIFMGNRFLLPCFVLSSIHKVYDVNKFVALHTLHAPHSRLTLMKCWLGCLHCKSQYSLCCVNFGAKSFFNTIIERENSGWNSKSPMINSIYISCSIKIRMHSWLWARSTLVACFLSGTGVYDAIQSHQIKFVTAFYRTNFFASSGHFYCFFLSRNLIEFLSYITIKNATN